MQVDIERGVWVDPRQAEMPLAHWAEEFLALARRLAPSTQDTYRRDPRQVHPAEVRRLPARAAPGRRD
ncbi:MAG: hypothetical protein ACRD29_11690 [Acidimicrobiales bacterium]